MATTEEKLKDIENRVIALEQIGRNYDFHHHTGTDSDKVFYMDLQENKVWLRHTLPGTSAATAANYGVFFIAPWACVLTEFKEVHETAGTDGGAVTLDLEKLTGTTAPDSGTAMLSSTLSLKGTANTVQTGTVNVTISTRNIAAGDRLCLKDSGALTSVASVTVLVGLTIV